MQNFVTSLQQQKCFDTEIKTQTILTIQTSMLQLCTCHIIAG